MQTSQFFLSNQSHYFSTIEALLLAIRGCTGPHPANHILWQGCQSEGPELVTPSGHPVGITKPVQGVEGSATLTLVLRSPVTDLHTDPFTQHGICSTPAKMTQWNLSYFIDMLNFLKAMSWVFVLVHWGDFSHFNLPDDWLHTQNYVWLIYPSNFSVSLLYEPYGGTILPVASCWSLSSINELLNNKRIYAPEARRMAFIWLDNFVCQRK